MELRNLKILLSALCLILISAALNAQITPWEAASQMQKGINLGNTLEPPDEGGWNNGPAQEYYFDLYKSAGFQTVRIPVRWDEHTQSSPPYHVDDAWMNRVEQLVDWGLSRGLFIVINAHHEEWIKANYDNAGYRDRFDSIWSQISTRFKNKSDHLLFEIINEPYGLTKEQNDDLHQRVLSVIRKTNPTRIVIFQGHNWGGSDELIQAAIPDDDYLMGSFHSYDPYLFGLEGQGTWGTSGDQSVLNNKFLAVKNWSDEHHIPVFLGEFGAVKTCDYNSRMRHYRAYVIYAQIYGFVSCAWDDGGDFRIMERQGKSWNELKDILIHTSVKSPVIRDLKVVRDTMLELSWANPENAYDSIIIQRRTDYSPYTIIDTLAADSTTYLDSLVNQNQYYYYRVIGHYTEADDQYAQPVRNLVPVYVPKVRGFYNGTPSAVPGVIEAEDFDTGGEGFTYHDTDERNIPGKYRPDEGVDIFFINWESYQIGYTSPGEWSEYTLNVEQEGEYTIKTIVSAVLDGATFKLKIGDRESDVLTTPTSGSWFDTTSVSTTMTLPEGQQIMRFSILSDPDFHIDKFIFSLREEQKEDTTTISVTALPEPKLLLYQNTSHELVVKLLNGPAIRKVDIYTIPGRKIHAGYMSKYDNYLSVSDINPGLYIVNVFTHSQVFTGKVVIGR
ncbi:MAG TPA: cellulase family glycosylhydrolase [Bacteroidales bacterium]|nr:cellulase family glycosylhydrolase [Bacteroidales bacterium]